MFINAYTRPCTSILWHFKYAQKYKVRVFEVFIRGYFERFFMVRSTTRTTDFPTIDHILSFQSGNSFLIEWPVQVSINIKKILIFEAGPSIPSEPSKNQATVGTGIPLRIKFAAKQSHRKQTQILFIQDSLAQFVFYHSFVFT
jgi:hypothetical protein